MEIIATKLNKSFADKMAVSDISLQIRKGQTLGFLGPNGSGKSTTIKMLTGELLPTSGEIKYDGKSLDTLSRDVNELIGVMPQEVIVWDHLNIVENLQFTGTLYHLDSVTLTKRVDYLLEKLHLKDEAKTLARNLSGGYKRRLNLAISIVHDPKIIFLDEPTPGIDPQSRRAMWDFIDELKNTGDYSILLTDHYLDEAERVCDYIVIVDEGVVVAEGTLGELKKKHGKGKVLKIDFADSSDLTSKEFLHFNSEIEKMFDSAVMEKDQLTFPVLNPEKDISSILGLISKHDLQFDDVSIKEPSLEDIFLFLTGKQIRS